MWVLRFKRAALKRFTYLALFLFLLVGLALPFLAMAGDKGGLEKSKKDDLKIKDADFNKTIGGVKEGKSIWHYKEGFLLQNVTPETSRKGEYVNVEYENDSVFDVLNVSFRFYNGQAKVDFFEVFRNVSTQQTVFNRSDEEFFNATNASYWNATTHNYSTELSSEMKWVKVAPKILDNGSITYYTTDFIFGENIRAIPTPLIYGGVVKYDVLTCDGGNCNEIDPILNATFFNATSQADTNTSVPDFAPFCDGKFLMGAGNRSNITGCDSWGDLNYNANPDWKIYNLSVGGEDCPFGVSTTSANLSLSANDVGNGCTIEAIRDVNISVPKVAGIIVNFWMIKDTVDVNLEGGMCLLKDSIIANNTNIRCNGGNDILFVRDSNSHNIYPKGGVGAESWGSGSAAIQHVEVWSNWSHARGCFDGVCSGLIAYASTTEAENVFLALFLYDNTAFPRSGSFFNITIANATQFGQPFNYTPARFETVLMNSTAVVDKVRISNITYKYAGANANWFVMDKNHLNQQGVNEGTDTDITDITGSIVNATFAPQNINVTSELYAVQVEWTPVAAAPSVVLPFVNVSIINRTSSNASVILASEHVWSKANYSHASNLPEANSTFKWYTNSTFPNGTRNSSMVAMIYKDAVGYWHLDENGGTNGYADSSGFGNTALAAGSVVTNVSGIIGGAINLTKAGLVGFLTIPYTPSLNISQNITVSGWFKTSISDGSDDGLVSRWANTVNQSFIMWTYVHNIYFDGSTGSVVWTNGMASLNNSGWHNIVGTINGTTGKIYFDGEEKASGTTSITNFGNYPIEIGTYGARSNSVFPGAIDEVAIYNRSLSASEIKQLYLRSWYDVSPQLFLLNGESLSRLNASNLSDFNTTDMERPTTISGATLQPGRFVENLTVDVNTSGYWRFDVDGSPVVGSTPDLSGNGNNGSVQGAAFVNDSAGGLALKFDGVNDFLNISDSNSLDTGSSVTIGLWAKRNINSIKQVMAAKVTLTSPFNGWQLSFETTNLFRFATTLDNVWVSTYSVSTITDSAWHYYTASFNGSLTKIYIDGVDVTDTSQTGSVLGTNSFNLVVGMDAAGANGFNGTIDEVRILNRSLSAAEVLSDYRKAAKGLGLLSNDYLNYSAAGNFNEKEGTIEFWVKPEWNGDDGMGHEFVNIQNNYGSSSERFSIRITNANDLQLAFGDTSATVVGPKYSTSDWLAGDWHHVAATWNNYTSNMTLHVDGTQVNNSGTAFTIGTVGQRLTLGRQWWDGPVYANATFSEFRISRKALTAQEINLTYSKGRPYFQNEYLLNRSNYAKGDALVLEYKPVDNASSNGTMKNSSVLMVQNSPPSGSISFPLNNINTTLNWINVTNLSDADGDTITIVLSVNGTFNQSSTANMTLAATAERNYVINVSFFDGTDYWNGTGVGNLTVSYQFDNLTPMLNNATNSNATVGNPIYIPKNSVFLNFTYTEPLNSTFTIQNGTGGVNNNITAVTANGNAFWYTFVGLNDANYTFKGYINDTSGNYNRTGNISATIDTLLPVPLFTPPTPANNSLTANNRINISTNITETNFMNMTISIFNQTGLLNRTGFTSPNASVNYTLNDGVYQISITAYDLANNSNTSLSTNFTIDTTAPNISVERPFQNEKTGATFNIQFQVNDTTGISQCNITSGVLGTISNGTALNVSNGQENNHMNASGLLPGNQVSFSVRCIDLAGNTAVSPVRTFSIAERAGFVGGDGGVQGDVMQKKQCAAGEKPFSLNETDYCISCSGTVATVGGKVYCVEKSEPVQASMNPLQSLPGSKGATILMVMALVAYVVFGTSLIFKKKPKVKFNG